MSQGTSSSAIGAGGNSLNALMQNPQLNSMVSTLATPNSSLQPSFGGQPVGTGISGVGGAGK